MGRRDKSLDTDQARTAAPHPAPRCSHGCQHLVPASILIQTGKQPALGDGEPGGWREEWAEEGAHRAQLWSGDSCKQPFCCTPTELGSNRFCLAPAALPLGSPGYHPARRAGGAADTLLPKNAQRRKQVQVSDTCPGTPIALPSPLPTPGTDPLLVRKLVALLLVNCL